MKLNPDTGDLYVAMTSVSRCWSSGAGDGAGNVAPWRAQGRQDASQESHRLFLDRKNQELGFESRQRVATGTADGHGDVPPLRIIAARPRGSVR